jgi:glucokinase
MRGAAMTTAPTLLADIGGTNARFGLVMPSAHTVEQVSALRCADYAGPAEAAIDYLGKHGMKSGEVKYAAFAVATPVNAPILHLTNSNWSLDRSAVAHVLGLRKLTVVNDFEALAMALPVLTAADYKLIGSAQPLPGHAKAVLGPGTGLGVAGVTMQHGYWVAIPGEGGHVTLAAADEFEAAVIRVARGKYPHVSAERLLSGIGLPVLYEAVCAVKGFGTEPLDAAQITERAQLNEDAACVATLDTFFALLGGFAGNVALTLGARGGLFIGGGIVPRLFDALARSRFRERFESKGRFQSYLQQISTAVITSKYPALFGLAQALNLHVEEVRNHAPP